MKVNLALATPPTFPGLRGRSAGGATVHLLPGGERPLDATRAMWADVQAGRLPDFPTIEWYLHTTVDGSLRDDAGRHSSALFVQSVPHQPAGSDWAGELDGYLAHLLEICDRFAPGTSASAVDTFALPPPGIEAHFGITGGHIHHVDNTVAFDARIPYATGLPRPLRQFGGLPSGRFGDRCRRPQRRPPHPRRSGAGAIAMISQGGYDDSAG